MTQVSKKENSDSRRFSRMQWRVLIATMIGYTLFYFMRKNFSFAMPGLEQDCGISKSQLGNFLFWGGIIYGLSKFLNGIIGDRVNSRKMLCLGLLACIIVNILFGFVPDFTSGSLTIWAFGILLVVSQFFQGTGFPPCARLIAHWVPPKELATKMGVWNTSHSIGGGLVAKLCGVIMGLGVLGAANQGVGMWKWCFWAMAIIGLTGLLVMWFILPGTPEEEGISVPSDDSASLKVQDIPSPHSSICKDVFLNPAIWMLGFCNFTINAVRALVADWGPTMLQETKGFSASETGTVIMLFEFAGIGGMLLSGWMTDRFFCGKAPRLCAILMFLTAVFLVLFYSLVSPALSSIALIASGFLLYGPQALTGVSATNLSSKHLTGTAIGFISLFSYIGVAVSGKLCGSLVQHSGGWGSAIFTMMAVSVIGGIFFLTLWKMPAYKKQS